MDYSDKLMHFPDRDPPSANSRDTVRERINEQTVEYLAQGKEIQQLTNQDYCHHVVTMRRQELINYLKESSYRRRSWNKINPD